MSSNQPLIVIGDSTTHGGQVITGDLSSTVGGKAMVREGDLTYCPKCRGAFHILRGNGIVFDGAGKTYARHGDRTACGAQLIATQFHTIAARVEDGVPVPADAIAEAKAIAAPTVSGVCLECLLKAATTGSSTVIRG
ncbi:PAAR domain-containing protein [Ralstonia pseudosolanacearum]|uniref:PAAR domain-containing protein n=1 Tax=Ralstonia solanacearum TaxID=305 RepID=A0AA92K160_RALSL|nr:PAAR domain-containing protein [Ralstonia pseudosolanacearum]QOK96333.1 PAAR domain-containing protein [Ralstonia pseudosolanacearum]